MPVERAETRRGQRLVDDGIAAYPRIALGDPRGEGREPVSKRPVEQVGPGRAAAMVDESDNRIDAEFAQPP